MRTAAQTEADSRFPETPFAPENEALSEAFTEGAVWGAALVTPTREQIAATVAQSLDPEYGIVEEVDLIAADAVLALMRGVSRHGS